MLKYKKITTLSAILLLISLFFSCDNKKPDIPVVLVNFQIDLYDPQYNDLNTVGNYIYVTGGVNGIIIYRQSQDVFFAYERTCPYDPECGKVFVDETGLIAKDTTCCNSEFFLWSEGMVAKGPSPFPLKQYYTIYNPNNRILTVSN